MLITFRLQLLMKNGKSDVFEFLADRVWQQMKLENGEDDAADSKEQVEEYLLDAFKVPSPLGLVKAPHVYLAYHPMMYIGLVTMGKY